MSLNSKKTVYNPIPKEVRTVPSPLDLGNLADDITHPWISTEPLNYNSLRRQSIKNVIGLEPIIQSNLEDREFEYVYNARLPESATATLEVKIIGDYLTIFAERCRATMLQRPETNSHTIEKVFGGIEKSIRIPADADVYSISASFDHYTLTIKMPKKESGHGRRVKLLSKPAEPAEQINSNQQTFQPRPQSQYSSLPRQIFQVPIRHN